MNENETKKETTKEEYVKPVSEIVKIELEQPILTGSAPNYGNGGRWGF